VDAAGNVIIADWFNSRVRAVLAKPPAFQTSPLVLNFAADAGSVAPTQTVSLSTAIPGLLYSNTATTTDGASWLQVTPDAGGMPIALTVTADATGLTPGSYRGTIRIAAPNASPAGVTVTANLTVRPAVPAKLGVKADALAFSFFQGSAPSSQGLTIANDGGTPLDYNVSVSGPAASSVTLTPLDGTLAAYTAATATVTANPSGLAPGTYTVTVAVTASTGEERDLKLTMTVSAIRQSISLLQRGLTFTAVAAGGVSPPQSIGVLNVGQGTMSLDRKNIRTVAGRNPRCRLERWVHPHTRARCRQRGCHRTRSRPVLRAGGDRCAGGR
jgi:hypothetical protein